MEWLQSEGHVVAVCRRPDREEQSGRSVDAELLFEGRLVAVEITQLHPIARALSEMTRLTKTLRESLEPQVRQCHLGYVLLNLECRQLPTKQEMRAAIPALLKDVETALGLLAPSPTSRMAKPVDTRVAFVKKLDLIQIPHPQDQVQWLVGGDETGGDLQEMADEFVCHLLQAKGTQADGYEEAWLLVEDSTGLVGVDLLTGALDAQRDHIPTNWKRIWFLPAEDPEVVIELSLGLDDSGSRRQSGGGGSPE